MIFGCFIWRMITLLHESISSYLGKKYPDAHLVQLSDTARQDSKRDHHKIQQLHVSLYECQRVKEATRGAVVIVVEARK